MYYQPPQPGEPVPPAAGRLAALARSLEESIRILEWRRYQRILAAGRLPFIYSAAVLLLAWLLVPFLFATGGPLATSGSDAQPGGAAGALLATTALAAALAAYLRAQHLWHQERQLHTFHNWLLSRQQPGRTVVTTVCMAALLGLAIVGVPAVLGLAVGLVAGMQPWQLLACVLLLALCSLAGAALGAAVFFVSYGLVSHRHYYPGLLAILAIVTCLWLRLESVENGWRRNWDEHPARIGRAVNLVTPIPAIFGAASPGWWDDYTRRPLRAAVPAWGGALLYALFLAGLAAAATRAAMRGYLALAEDPARMEEKPRQLAEEAGEEFYWKGFRNPVWTRDIRTRLRSKDTAEFIFFASVAVAAGAFVPLLMTASDLSDPLHSAEVAKQVFFWLTMTLVALVALIAPGLTADVVTQERSQGTLELLIGTPLRPREILTGKLLGGVSVLLLLLSPSLPLFGLCYLFHGASGLQVLGVYGLLIATLAISSLVGLTQSAIHTRSGVAKVWSYGLTALFVAFPGGPFWVAAAAAEPDAGMRQSLGSQGGFSAVLGVVWAYGLLLMWGNASEQLEYSEY